MHDREDHALSMRPPGEAVTISARASSIHRAREQHTGVLPKRGDLAKPGTALDHVARLTSIPMPAASGAQKIGPAAISSALTRGAEVKGQVSQSGDRVFR
jgi:hypothetical protein